MMLGWLLACMQNAAPAESMQLEWVVRDVIPGGPSPVAGFERRMVWVKAQGDLDRDGACDFLLQYMDGSLSGGYPWDGLYSVRRAGNIIEEIHRNRWSFGFNYGSWLSDVAVLDSPLGPLKTLSSDPGHLHRTFKANGTVVATASQPYEITYWVPDLDGDGYDDLFTQVELIGGAQSARIDGRTMAEVWTNVSGDPTGDCVISPYQAGSFADFDRDGVLDFLSIFPIWLGGPIEAQIYALSGADGSLIWSRNEANVGAVLAASVTPDLTGDGVEDVAFAVLGTWSYPSPRFMLIDGAIGTLGWSWNTANSSATPPLPGYVMKYLRYPIFVTDTPFAPGNYQVILHAEYEDANPSGPESSAFLHLDARTGKILGWGREPLHLEPWFPDEFDIYNSAPRTVLGDVDRDGLTEVGVLSNGWSVDIPGNSFIPWHLAITGQRTLFQPSSVRPGERLDYRIGIPGAPNHDYLLLLSLGFDRDGGERVDGWKTHLVADAAFAATLGGRYSGRLDARGVGSQSITLPPNASLSGKTLYAKVVVWKLGSVSEVWTMSSLGITEIR